LNKKANKYNYANDIINYIRKSLDNDIISKDSYSCLPQDDNQKVYRLICSMLVDRLGKIDCWKRFNTSLRIFVESLLVHIEKRNEPLRSITIESILDYLGNDFLDHSVFKYLNEHIYSLKLVKDGSNHPKDLEFLKSIVYTDAVCDAYTRLLNNKFRKNKYTINDIRKELKNIFDSLDITFYQSVLKTGCGYTTRSGFILIHEDFVECYDDIHLKAVLVITFIHEIAHRLLRRLKPEYLDFFRRTPKKNKPNEEGGEFGVEVEEILFGKKITKIGASDAKCVLSKENYKNLENFQNTFQKSLDKSKLNNERKFKLYSKSKSNDGLIKPPCQFEIWRNLNDDD